ncbi:MAG: DNA polymerase III subunit gamma/tau, partial [Betaproteobacteria bacterium]|nr:DNA polymerase III subunit gamma/tau [Betaproteobacteria bacterium]
ETGVTPEPCGRCSSCVEIDGGRFVDLLEVDAATNTKVDEMRQLLDTAQYAPTRARYKVYVIDEVHMLSNSAFNAMLKTLEEPPEHLKFILATTDPQKIPVTVLSRCLQFNLKQMPRAAIVAHLAKLLEAEAIVYEREALPLIGRAAAGSMRDALSLLDQAIAHGGGRIGVEGVREMLGAIDESYLFRLLDAVAARDAAAAIAVAAEMQERSLSFDHALADLGSILVRVAVAQSIPEALEDDMPERERISALAARLEAETVQLYYQIAMQGHEDLRFAPDEHSGFVMTVLRMLAFRPEGEDAPLVALPVARVATISDGKQDAPAALSRRGAAATPAGTGGEARIARDNDWGVLASEIQVTGATRELVRNAVLHRVREGAYDFRIPKSMAHLASYQDKLKSALEQHLGRRVTVKVSVGDVQGGTVAAREAGEREARKAEAVQTVQADSFVQDLVNMFDARVVDTSVKGTSKDS